MSSFSGLSVALSSLQAQRRAMDVTGQNVANASTVGYTRQRATLQALGPPSLYSLQGTGSLHPGNGVTVSAVSRLGDELASSRLRAATGDSGYLNARTDALSQIESRFAEPSDSGLSAQLSELWQAWGDLSNSPGEPSARSALVQQANTVAGALRAGHAGVATQWSQTRDQALALQTEINSVATSVAELNKHIRATAAVDGQANELTDQRDQLVLRLSELTGSTGQAQADGTMRVLIGGVPLVDGDRAHTITLDAPLRLQDVSATSPARFTWADGSPVALTGGRLASVVESLQTTLPGVASGYDAVAVALAQQINSIHSTGHSPGGDTGLDFFVMTGTGAGAAQIGVNPTLVADPMKIAAAEGTGGAMDGSLADRIAGTKNLSTGADQVWRAFVVATGVESGATAQRARVVGGVVSNASAQLLSATGVDLDEEMTNLLMFQRAYEGASRVLTAIDQALDHLINRTGVVGR